MEAGSLAGRVVRPDGRAVQNVRLTFTIEGVGIWSVECRSDEDGRFEVGKLPIEADLLRVEVSNCGDLRPVAPLRVGSLAVSAVFVLDDPGR